MKSIERDAEGGYKVAEQFGLSVVPLALAPETLAPLKPLSGATLDAVTRCAEQPAQFRETC